jgi:hypothetical protein
MRVFEHVFNTFQHLRSRIIAPSATMGEVPSVPHSPALSLPARPLEA